MKTNKLYITISVIIWLLIIWLLSVESFNKYSKEKWANSWKNNTQKELQINSLKKEDLTKQEELALYYQYNEEKVAYDLYTHFYELYKDETFNNIAHSEAKHMEAVKWLIDKYNLTLPKDFWELTETYNSLKLEWEKWLKEALEVWLKVEMLDIDDISKTIKLTDNEDLKIVFLNIWWASFNHLRWFSKWLAQNNLTTNIDFSKYLSSDELNTKWSLKDKLVQKLESEWVILPENVKTQVKNENWNHSDWNHNWMWKWKWNWMWRNNH